MSLLQKLSWECSHTQIPINVPGRVKTRYTANLNPFRPFTLVNKKEKVVQQGGTYYQHRFVCNKWLDFYVNVIINLIRFY